MPDASPQIHDIKGAIIKVCLGFSKTPSITEKFKEMWPSARPTQLIQMGSYSWFEMMYP